MSARFLLKLLTGVAAFVAIGCGGESSTPTAPTAPPPVVAPPPQPPPVARGHVDASVVPNPVPFSGDRIQDVPGCVVFSEHMVLRPDSDRDRRVGGHVQPTNRSVRRRENE